MISIRGFVTVTVPQCSRLVSPISRWDVTGDFQVHADDCTEFKNADDNAIKSLLAKWMLNRFSVAKSILLIGR